MKYFINIYEILVNRLLFYAFVRELAAGCYRSEKC